MHASTALLALAALSPSLAKHLASRSEMQHDSQFLPRQDTPSSPSSSLSALPGLPTAAGSLPAAEMAEWDRVTGLACMEKLSELTKASNPSGISICYNLPTLRTDTGVFVADLRMFRINDPDPEGPFAGIAQSSVNAGLIYDGARALEVTEQAVMNGQIGGGQTDLRKSKREVEPELLKAYLFVGQIDSSRMAEDMAEIERSAEAEADLEALVMPVLQLTATSPTGQQVVTNVSSNEAAFLTGFFSNSSFQSDFSRADDMVTFELARLESGDVAFVLPGVEIMIFPVGLIITLIWLVAGVGAYGFGTYERMKYAQTYRTRTARTGSAEAKRI